MKFSDDLLKTVSTILEQKPRISFHETGADVLDKAGNKVRSFSRKDLGEKYKKEAENFLSMNYKKLNAESVHLTDEMKPKKKKKHHSDEDMKEEMKHKKKKKHHSDEDMKEEMKHKGKKHKKDKGDMDGDGVDEPDSKEYMDNKDKAIKKAMGKKVDEEMKPKKKKGKKHMDEESKDHVDAKKSADCGEGEYFCKDEKKCKPIPDGMKLEGEQLVKEEMNPSSTDPKKIIGHKCATHVEHKEHGLGECIPGMHTLEEIEDSGEGYVTHYDVMFTNDNGPFIVENVSVDDLEIIHESHHGHMKKKKKSMKSEEYSDDVKKKVNQGKMPHPEDPHGHLSGKQRKHQEKRDGLEAGYHKGYISDKDYDKGHKKLDKKYGTNYEEMKPKKKKGMKPINKEHVDSIAAALQEISKKTMGSYVKKAGEDIADRAYHSGGDRQDNEFNSSEKTPERKKLVQRQKGIKTAIDKLTKESNEMTDRMADHISGMPETSHRKKVAKKKAMKAFDKGDYEKAAHHADIHLQHPD